MSYINPQIPTIGGVVDDLSPQLGGSLDVNAYGIRGATGSGAGAGGNMLIYGGNGGPTGDGGYMFLTAGAGGSSGNGNGGTCYVYGGTGRGTGTGGQMLIKSGFNTNTGVGGTINILAGTGGGGGGPINITGGAVTSTQNPYAGAGGGVTITGGVSSGDNPGGDITLVSGAAGPAKPGVQVVDVGNSRTPASPTGLANDATVYTAAIVVDGGSSQPISVVGSAAQTYATLVSELNADTTGATWAVTFFDLQVDSDTTGSSSSVAITDTDLFSSLSNFVAINSAIAGTDAGSAGAIVIPTQTAPAVTTNKLYNVAGALTWNGTDLTAGGGAATNLATTGADVVIGAAAPPTTGQTLTATSATTATWQTPAAAGIANVVEDTTPQLGGNLDVNGNDIVSVSNGDIDIIPNGSGRTRITNIEAPLQTNTQTGTSYTAVLDDAEKMITLNNAAAITVTIPANASVAYPVGTKLNFMQLGAGQVTVAITSDTLNVESTLTLLLVGQYAVATAFKVTATTWVLFGNLEAA